MDEELRRLLEDLEAPLEEYRRTGTLSAQSLDKVRQNATKAAEAQQENTDAVQEATRNIRRFYERTLVTAGQLGNTAQGLRDNRENFEALNPAIRATGTVITTAGNAVGGLTSAIGAAITSAGIFGSIFGGPLGLGAIVLGVGLQGLGSVLSTLNEEVARGAVAFGEFSTGEITRLVNSFRRLGSVGAIGAQGIDDLTQSARRAGLSNEQFSTIVAGSAKSLSFFGGDTFEGSQALAALSEASRSSRGELLNLGIGFVEQNELLAENTAFLQRTGQIQTRDTKQLAEASNDYIYELTALSRLTGLTRTEQQAAIDQQMQNLRARATIERIAMEQGNATNAAGQRVGDAIRFVTGSLAQFPGIAEGIANSLSGAPVGEAAEALAFTTKGASVQIATALAEGRISQGEALVQLQAMVQQFRTAMLENRVLERAGGLGTILDTLGTSVLDFANKTLPAANEIDNLKGTLKIAAETENENTNRLKDAQIAMQYFAKQMDSFVDKNILPLATTSIQFFTGQMLGAGGALLKLMDDFLNASNTSAVQTTPSEQDVIDAYLQNRTGGLGAPVMMYPSGSPYGGASRNMNLPSPQASVAGPRSTGYASVTMDSLPADVVAQIVKRTEENAKSIRNSMPDYITINRASADQNTLLEQIAKSTADNVIVSREILRRALA